MNKFRGTIFFFCLSLCRNEVVSQRLDMRDVPAAVIAAYKNNYPAVRKLTWEKEKGNYEANWGGVSGEDTSVLYSPAGAFVERVVAIPVKSLPANVFAYIRKNYGKVSITEAGRVTDAAGKHFFEVEVKGRDHIFGENGEFLRKD